MGWGAHHQGGEEFWTSREGGRKNLESLGKLKGHVYFFCLNKVIRERYKDLRVVWPPIP